MTTEDLGDPDEVQQQEQTPPVGRSVVPGRCKICRATPASIFYGVKSCRACKGIFKRGIKKKFLCPFDSVCDVKTGIKDRCKACVFAKCVRKGMIAQDTGVPAGKTTENISVKTKPVKTPKAKKDAVLPPKIDRLPVVDRYYEVKEDLKSLFQPSETAKPFRFFENEVDEFDVTSGLRPIHSASNNGYGQDEDDVIDDGALPSKLIQGVQSLPGQMFFFSVNDPRLAEGMKFLTLDETEMGASLENWKKNRPQIAADFKKLKKNANRKRKTFER